MKIRLLALAIITTAALLTAGDAAPRVIYVSHDRVEAALAHSGGLIKAPDFLVMGSHRTGPGHVELHEKETDVFYVTDGDATFVTGGKMLGGRLVSPGQYLGTDISGGEVHHLSKGDVITIAAGTPHWFKRVPREVSYFVVKVLKH